MLQGWGGEALLESYERERGPVHRFVIEEATGNHAVTGAQLWQDGLEDDTEQGAALRKAVGAKAAAAKLREFHTLGVVLGYRYTDSPVIATEARPASRPDFINYVPTSHPGHLAPHAWLHDGTSLYDHFGHGFTLLETGSADGSDAESARLDARTAGVPLRVIRPQESGLKALYPTRYTLIRPDQHVAWRGDDWPRDASNLLLQVSGRKAAG